MNKEKEISQEEIPSNSYWRKNQKVFNIMHTIALILCAIVTIPIAIIGFFINSEIFFRIDIIILLAITVSIQFITFLISDYADKKVKELEDYIN